MSPQIFVSYRHVDSQAITDRIYERLYKGFGEKHIFRDIDAIPLGKDFRDEVKKAITKSDVILVIIGKNGRTKAI